MILNKRGQEMPMQTIVMIIIVLLVLAAVGVFFFQQFATGQKGTGSAQCVQLCQSIQATLASNSTMIWSNIKGSGAGSEFCTKACYSSITCNVRTAVGTTAAITSASC